MRKEGRLKLLVVFMYGSEYGSGCRSLIDVNSRMSNLGGEMSQELVYGLWNHFDL